MFEKQVKKFNKMKRSHKMLIGIGAVILLLIVVSPLISPGLQGASLGRSSGNVNITTWWPWTTAEQYGAKLYGTSSYGTTLTFSDGTRGALFRSWDGSMITLATVVHKANYDDGSDFGEVLLYEVDLGVAEYSSAPITIPYEKPGYHVLEFTCDIVGRTTAPAVLTFIFYYSDTGLPSTPPPATSEGMPPMETTTEPADVPVMEFTPFSPLPIIIAGIVCVVYWRARKHEEDEC